MSYGCFGGIFMAECSDMSSSTAKAIFEDAFTHDADKLAEWEAEYEEKMGEAPVPEDHPIIGYLDSLMLDADGNTV